MADSMDIDGGGTASTVIMDHDMGDDDDDDEEVVVPTTSRRDREDPFPLAPTPATARNTMHRRGSMSHDEEKQRRASIKAILADESLPIQERRRSIQSLMDGRRSSIGTNSVASTASTTNGDENPYGYSDTEEDPRGGNHDYEGGGAGGLYLESCIICEPVSNEMTMRAEQTRPPCPHYDRKCTLVSPCCGAAFGCRICHDDSPVLPPLLMAKRMVGRYGRSASMPTNPSLTPEETHHNIDRFAIKEVICRQCYTKQSSKTYVYVQCLG